MFLPLLVLLTPVRGPEPAPAPPPAAAATRYKVDLRSETVVDLSVLGGPSNTLQQMVTAWVAVSFADTAGGRTLHVAIDSVVADGVPPVFSKEMADSARGAFLHGFVDSRNHIKRLDPSPNAGLLAASLAASLNAFLPRIKGAAGGVDTAETTSDAPGQKVRTTVVTTYTASGTETVAGLTATKYTTAFTTTSTGTLETQGGPAEMEGTGTGTGTEFVGPGGIYLGGSRSAKVDQRVKLAMAPAAIPVSLTQTITVTVLR